MESLYLIVWLEEEAFLIDLSHISIHSRPVSIVVAHY